MQGSDAGLPIHLLLLLLRSPPPPLLQSRTPSVTRTDSTSVNISASSGVRKTSLDKVAAVYRPGQRRSWPSLAGHTQWTDPMSSEARATDKKERLEKHLTATRLRLERRSHACSVKGDLSERNCERVGAFPSERHCMQPVSVLEAVHRIVEPSYCNMRVRLGLPCLESHYTSRGGFKSAEHEQKEGCSVELSLCYAKKEHLLGCRRSWNRRDADRKMAMLCKRGSKSARAVGEDQANKRPEVGLERACIAEQVKAASWRGQGTWLATENQTQR